MELSKRLQAVAELVTPDLKVAKQKRLENYAIQAEAVS